MICVCTHWYRSKIPITFTRMHKLISHRSRFASTVPHFASNNDMFPIISILSNNVRIWVRFIENGSNYWHCIRSKIISCFTRDGCEIITVTKLQISSLDFLLKLKASPIKAGQNIRSSNALALCMQHSNRREWGIVQQRNEQNKSTKCMGIEIFSVNCGYWKKHDLECFLLTWREGNVAMAITRYISW